MNNNNKELNEYWAEVFALFDKQDVYEKGLVGEKNVYSKRMYRRRLIQIGERIEELSRMVGGENFFKCKGEYMNSKLLKQIKRYEKRLARKWSTKTKTKLISLYWLLWQDQNSLPF
jgi:hypothetical protein